MTLSFLNNLYNKNIDELYNNAEEFIKVLNNLYGTNELNRHKDKLLEIQSKYLEQLYKHINKKQKEHHTEYYVFVANSKITYKLFIIYCVFVYANTLLNKEKKLHIGYDFEFNLRKIALMQINFEFLLYKVNVGHLWIVDPNDYNTSDINIIVQTIILNKHLYKILHGADSLDIPYIYTELLKNNKEDIIKFTKKVLDTRFICEYVRISKDEGKKCSLYDALKYFKTIDDEKYDKLNEIHESMGPVQDISWNINKMSSFHMSYAYYDVLYLQTFLKDMYGIILKDTPDYVASYKYANEIIRFTLLDKKKVIDTVSVTESDISTMNNYFIKSGDNNMTFITIFNSVINDLIIKINGDIVNVNFIMSQNYIKNSFNVILKKLLYYKIQKLFTVYKTKNEELVDKIAIKHIFDDINGLGFKKISKMLKSYLLHIEDRLKIYN